MAIKGLTDRAKVAQFPYIGKLRKGGPSESGIGPDLDYFRFTSDRPEVMRAFSNAYGQQPRSLEVVLPYATTAENFDVWQEAYTAGGFVHRCDGETMVLWRDAKGVIRHDPQPCPYAGQPRTKDTCKAVGRLTVILPRLLEAGYVGYVTAETHSLNDIINLKDSLDATYQSAALHGADLRGILYTLYRAAASISTPSGKDGKRARREKWLLYIVPAIEWVQGMQRLAAQSQAEIVGDEVRMIAAPPRAVDVVTGEVLDGPENADDEVEAPNAPPANAWIFDAQTRKDFWAHVDGLGLSHTEGHKALGVFSLKDYTGTLEQAKARLADYIDERIDAEQQAAQEEADEELPF